MRLIDADKAKAKLLRMVADIHGWGEFFDGIRSGYQSAADRLDTMPTVEERKCGHWKCEDYLLGTTHRCSRCSENYGMPHEIYNFCPNCGAKMENNGDDE